MFFLKLRDFLVNFLTRNECQYDQSNSVSVSFGQSDLHHRLQCTDLDDDEVKCLQAYLTIILENRNSKETSDLATTARSNCMVLEMEDKELRKFAHYIGEKGIRLFRAIVKSDNSQTQTRKLAIVGENGMRVFHVLVQGSNSLLQK